MASLLERFGMAPAPPAAKPKGLGGFSLPWRSGEDVKGGKSAKTKTPLIGKFKGFQSGLVDKLKDQASAAITGGVSGVLVLLTVYKVVSSRESVLAESRKEEQRVMMERKERLAVMRRSLAGPLRSAARDLNTRLREILQPTPATGEQRNNYFASHYLEDPEESINTTLYRLCRYVFWVEQLQRGIRSDGDLAMDDAWQIAVDVRLERVRQALASSDVMVDATKPRERLYDVIDAAVARDAAKRLKREKEALIAKNENENADFDTGNGSSKPLEKNGPSFKATARVLGATAGTLAAQAESPQRVTDDLNGESNSQTQKQKPTLAHGVSFALTESPDEPGLRVGRFPLRLFRDTQTAIAEVFGEEYVGVRRRGGGHSAKSVSSNSSTNGTQNSGTSKHDSGRDFSGREGGEMLYTDFVIKLEKALSSGQGANEPWARWMVPLHLQYHRYASLQARRQKQLTPAQGREVLAARVRLHRVSQSLDELLAVLRKRLDDPWFLHSMKRLKKEAARASQGDSYSFADAVKVAASKDVESEKLAPTDGKLAMKRRNATKRGIFAQFRTARFFARQRVLRSEAVERWAVIRDAIPEVTQLGAEWWNREREETKGDSFFGFHFKEDGAKAAQVAVASARWAQRFGAKCVHVLLDAAAERPVRALACIAATTIAGVAKDRKKRGKEFRFKLPKKLRRRYKERHRADVAPVVQESSGQKMNPREWIARKSREFTDFQTQPPLPSAPAPSKLKSHPPLTPPPLSEGGASLTAPRRVQPVPPPQPPVGKAPPPPHSVMPSTSSPLHIEHAKTPQAPVKEQVPPNAPKATPAPAPKATAPAPAPAPAPATTKPSAPAVPAAKPGDNPAGKSS